MFQVSIEQHFDAAHFLRGYQGKCEALHGHRFGVIARVKAAKVDDTGMAYDFTLLKKHLGDIIIEFDHTCLNNLPPFDEINPSSENIAITIYNRLVLKLSGEPVSVACIEVWESPGSGIAYSPE